MRWIAVLLIGLVSVSWTSPAHATSPEFIRGECNLDGVTDIADVVFMLNNFFPPPGSGPGFECADACDANDDGAINIADAVTLLTTLFPTGMPVPLPAPYGQCGVDPTMDNLDCANPGPPCSFGPLPFVSLAQGEISGLDPQVTIIRDEATWIAIWAEHTSNQGTTPPVAFGAEMVVVVVRGFSTAGATVTIDDVSTNSTGIEVSFTTNNCPSPLPVATTPYHFVVADYQDGATTALETITMDCP